MPSPVLLEVRAAVTPVSRGPRIGFLTSARRRRRCPRRPANQVPFVATIEVTNGGAAPARFSLSWVRAKLWALYPLGPGTVAVGELGPGASSTVALTVRILGGLGTLRWQTSLSSTLIRSLRERQGRGGFAAASWWRSNRVCSGSRA